MLLLISFSKHLSENGNEMGICTYIHKSNFPDRSIFTINSENISKDIYVLCDRCANFSAAKYLDSKSDSLDLCKRFSLSLQETIVEIKAGSK